MKTITHQFLALAAASIALPAFGQIVITDFSTVSGLQLNGAAAIAGSALRVTPAAFNQGGSAFSTAPISLNSLVSFSSYFQFRISGNGGIADSDGVGADGITFVVQTVANNVGAFGGGIGYQGVAKSVGVEFDTWDNGPTYGDPDGNHVAFNYGGSFSPAADAVPVGLHRLNNGNVWSAWVDYNGATQLLELRLRQGPSVRPLLALLADTVDLAAELGSTSAFVGFTSGTGAAYGNHDILRFEFVPEYSPLPGAGENPNPAVPEPSTYGLAAVALLGAVVAYRRRAR